MLKSASATLLSLNVTYQMRSKPTFDVALATGLLKSQRINEYLIN